MLALYATTSPQNLLLPTILLLLPKLPHSFVSLLLCFVYNFSFTSNPFSSSFISSPFLLQFLYFLFFLSFLPLYQIFNLYHLFHLPISTVRLLLYKTSFSCTSSLSTCPITLISPSHFLHTPIHLSTSKTWPLNSYPFPFLIVLLFAITSKEHPIFSSPMPPLTLSLTSPFHYTTIRFI